MAALDADARAGHGYGQEHGEAKETKTFSKTSEFFVWLGTVLAILIAALVIKSFGPDQAWLFVTILSSAYIISRGIAKSGARKNDHVPSWQVHTAGREPAGVSQGGNSRLGDR